MLRPWLSFLELGLRSPWSPEPRSPEPTEGGTVVAGSGNVIAEAAEAS